MKGLEKYSKEKIGKPEAVSLKRYNHMVLSVGLISQSVCWGGKAAVRNNRSLPP